MALSLLSLVLTSLSLSPYFPFSLPSSLPPSLLFSIPISLALSLSPFLPPSLPPLSDLSVRGGQESDGGDGEGAEL